jgi:iron complex outermembrane recepter protein
MFRKISLYILLIGLSVPAAISQRPSGARYQVSGKVSDSTDNQPMPMVAVGINEHNIWTVTNIEGNFTLRNIPEGKHIITVRCLGYTTVEHSFSVPDQLTLHVRLTPTSLALWG